MATNALRIVQYLLRCFVHSLACMHCACTVRLHTSRMPTAKVSAATVTLIARTTPCEKLVYATWLRGAPHPTGHRRFSCVASLYFVSVCEYICHLVSQFVINDAFSFVAGFLCSGVAYVYRQSLQSRPFRSYADVSIIVCTVSQCGS